jgi:hypothetical protein
MTRSTWPTAGQRVALAMVADERALDVYHGDVLLKRLPLPGLRGEVLLSDDYVALIEREARAEARRHRPRLAA